MKLKLENIVWGKEHWERIRNGGVWAVPCLCGIMQRTPKGFSLMLLMPYTDAIKSAAMLGMDVPGSAADLLAFQRHSFNLLKEHFEAAGLTFDDPKNLLGN